MTPTELASTIKLNPRAVVISGSLTARTKNSAESGEISGFSPHHARKGIPLVPFEGDEPAPVHMEGACIECDIREQSILPAAAASYGRTLNLVHLIFGNENTCPTNNEFKCLREAGEILKANVGQPVHLAALPILLSGAYGVAQGRLYVLALFDHAGNCLFLNPAAKDAKILQAEYPQTQKIRSLAIQVAQVAPAPAPAPVAAIPGWYPAMADTIATLMKLKGAKLHEAVLNTRASQVAKEQKITPKAALALVTEELEQAKQASKAQAAVVAAKTVPVAPQPAAPARKSLLSARV